MSIQDLFEAILGGVEGPPEQQERRRRSALPQADALPSFDGGSSGDVMHAVVQIVALKAGMLGGMQSAWTGSGTIVHPAGLILTNCHVANPRAMGMSSPKADRLGIAITERSDTPPALSYFGKVVAQSPELDLAVIRIVADVNGRRVSRLQLPFVPLGDSDELRLGERVSIFGYPGIGGETVTFTSGNVSGFTGEKQVRSNRAWIKTDATIAGGNSGGTAVNEDGELVGVPTQASAGSGVTPVDARPVLDTNRDGRIDQRDTPMAIGGFINGLRPINLAVPLLKKAGMDVDQARQAHANEKRESAPPQNRSRAHIPDYDHDQDDDPFSFEYSAGRDNPEFRELVFCTHITSDGRPIRPTSFIPGGVGEVYATFEFADMKPGTPWSAVWMTEGNVIIEQKDTWDAADGEVGRKSVKISNRNGVPDGEYHLVLGIGSKVALEGKMTVGNPVDESDSELSGQLVDAENGRGIANALVVILKPRVAMRDFLRNQSEDQVLTSTESDREGNFTLPKQLPKGEAYSLVAAARGYRALTVEGALRLGAGAPEKAHVGRVEMEPV